MAKQTAVDWLIHNITEDQMVRAKSLSEWTSIFEQAKAKEKDQMIDAYVHGCNATYGIDEPNHDPNYDRNEAEGYLIKTYKETEK